MMFKDYYKILGINKSASNDQIKASYRQMSLKWHPDKNKGMDVTSIMQDINEAYKILYDDITRARYDVEYDKFILFKEQSTFANDSQNNNRSKFSSNGNESHNRSNEKRTGNSYDYEYDIKDEQLKDDIDFARDFARKLVKEFLDSLKNDTKTACKGAWDAVKYYILVAIIFSFIGLLMMILYGS